MSAIHSALNAQDLEKLLDSLAKAVAERHGDCSALALIGIQRRGVDIASALQKRLEKSCGVTIPLGSLDIALYRDDWTVSGHKPAVGSTRIPFDVENKTLILVDDVLFTGRTIRAALEALVDYGRPSRIELLVLVDRGHRELPIQADYVGISLETDRADRVDVLVSALDGEEGVRLVTP